MPELRETFTHLDVLNVFDSFPAFHCVDEAVNYYCSLLEQLLRIAGVTEEALVRDLKIEGYPVREDNEDYLLVQVFKDRYLLASEMIYGFIDGSNTEDLSVKLAGTVCEFLEHYSSLTGIKKSTKIDQAVPGSR